MSSGILDDVLAWFRAGGHCLACLFIGNTVTCTGDLRNVTCRGNLPTCQYGFKTTAPTEKERYVQACDPRGDVFLLKIKAFYH